MSNTSIEIEEYKGNELETTYYIKDTFSDKPDTDEITLFKIDSRDKTEETVIISKSDLIKDYITLQSNMIGNVNKIHIKSLSEADKDFFEQKKLNLPKCIEFISDVPLGHTPSINDTREEETECPICKNELFGKDDAAGDNRDIDVVMLTSEQGCGHKFHKECIDQALKIKRECPICRSNVNGEIYIKKPLNFMGGKKSRKTRQKTQKKKTQKKKTRKRKTANKRKNKYHKK